MDFKALTSQFESLFRQPVDLAVRAPGRVNLIGEHTDYNGGLVLPIAIERQTVALVARRTDRKVALASNQAPGLPLVRAEPAVAWRRRPGEPDQQLVLDMDQPIFEELRIVDCGLRIASPKAGGQRNPQSEIRNPQWTDYPRGVLEYLRQREPAGLGGKRLVGMNILLDSDVPLGGGLSSSASMEVAIAVAALSACDARGAVNDRDLALLCQKAENVYAGAPCGIMDQSVIVMAQAGRALLLDCRDGSTRHIPFNDPNLVLLVADTQVKHAICDGGYGARRQQCANAAAVMGVQFLRELDSDGVDAAGRDGKLTGKELMRARHVVGEIGRTLDAVQALQNGDYHAFGRLMYSSHESLRDDYEVSCDELDAIVATAGRLDGVYGARMTGGGFGGCAIILAEANQAATIKQAIADAFATRFGRACPIFATHAAAGADVISNREISNCKLNSNDRL